MSADFLDEIVKSLGVPKWLFEGDSALSSSSVEFQKLDEVRIARMWEKFTDRVLQPLLER